MRQEVLVLAVPTSVTNGAAQQISNYREGAVQFHGTGSLTFKLQGKISGTGADAHDDWVDLEVAAATARIVQVPNGLSHIRVAVTAYVSGTFSAHYGAKNSRTDG